jgi:ribosomal protein S12 methylthiotransferase
VDDILREARALAESGVVELNLIAQSLTSFGWDRRERGGLMALLRPLTRIDGLRRIRLFYTYPTDISDALLDFIAAEPKICNYVDLPLQHIDDAMLRRMNRKGGSRLIRALLARIRAKIPDVTLRSTFIVGFPGETEAQVDAIAELLREIQFDRLGVFTYSQEDGTAAFGLGDPVPGEVKTARQERLLALQSGIMRAKQAALVGSVQEVLVDGPARETELLLEGRTQGQAPDIDGVVYINDGAAAPGEIVRVKITQAGECDLVGHVISRKSPAPKPKRTPLPIIS